MVSRSVAVAGVAEAVGWWRRGGDVDAVIGWEGRGGVAGRNELKAAGRVSGWAGLRSSCSGAAGMKACMAGVVGGVVAGDGMGKDRVDLEVWQSPCGLILLL